MRVCARACVRERVCERGWSQRQPPQQPTQPDQEYEGDDKGLRRARLVRRPHAQLHPPDHVVVVSPHLPAAAGAAASKLLGGESLDTSHAAAPVTVAAKAL